MIKLSAPDWCFFREGMNPTEYYHRLYELGYQGAELVAPERFDAARGAGLTILNLQAPGIEHGLNRLQLHAELLPQIRETIERAGENRIPYVIIFSGVREGQSDQEGLDNCRRAIELLLPDAERAGVTLCFEMLNAYDHPDHQAVSSADGFKLAEIINSPRLKLTYDIYHMEQMGENSPADITAHLAHIAHIHVAEIPQRNCPQPHGVIRYAVIVPRVIKAGYQGYWGMEFEPSSDDVFAELEAAARLFQELAGKV